MNTLIPCYIKLLRHDLGLQPLKIISFVSNKAKRLGGMNTGYSQEKPPHLTRNNKTFLSHIWPDQSPNPSGELIVWFSDNSLKGAFFPHSWEDIDPEINFSQMLHSARIYQFPLINGLCCIQTTHTVQKLHWECYNTEFACTERKTSISITFILGCKLTNQSWSSLRNINKTARKSLKFQEPDMGAFKDNIPL